MKNRNRQATAVYQQVHDVKKLTDFEYEEIEALAGASMPVIDADTSYVILTVGADVASKGVLLPEAADLEPGRKIKVVVRPSANQNKLIIGSDDAHYTIHGENVDTTKTLDYGYSYEFTLITPASAIWGVTAAFAEDEIIDA